LEEGELESGIPKLARRNRKRAADIPGSSPSSICESGRCSKQKGERDEKKDRTVSARDRLALVAWWAGNGMAAEKLPRVLIIGDSISIGYTPFVKDLFKGKPKSFTRPATANRRRAVWRSSTPGSARTPGTSFTSTGACTT
jgi:hypothetical protein